MNEFYVIEPCGDENLMETHDSSSNRRETSLNEIDGNYNRHAAYS